MRLPSELPQDLRHRPFTVVQAQSAGLTRRRLRASDLVRPCRGARVSAAAEDTLLVRATALVAVTGGVVSHLSAALLWGFPLPVALENINVVHLTCAGGQRAVRRKGVMGHQLVLQPGEITIGRHVQCTSPLRTWFDLAGILGLGDLVIAGEVRLLLRRQGLPEPAINVPMFDSAGSWIQDPDMSYEREKIAIQYDGGHHASPAQRRSDIFRDENAKEAGWRVVVLTQRDLDPFAPGTEPSALTRVRKALVERGWAPEQARRRRSSDTKGR